ncbi:hypothetical protein ACWDRR_00720 [Kitasatospora sp. NPDC003701]
MTSVINMQAKPFLQHWSAKMTAELCVDSLEFIAQMAERDREGAVQYLKGAASRYTKARAELGSSAHDLFERMARGQVVGRVHPDLVPYHRHFAEFLDRAQPEVIAMEEVAWSDRFGYAGSFDALMRISGELVMVDFKTSKSTYPEVSLQLSAYAFADRVIPAEGDPYAMPKVDAGAVLHVTGDQWALKPVEVSERVFTHFRALLHMHRWDRDVSKGVLGKPVLSGGPEALVTGTQRRAN